MSKLSEVLKQSEGRKLEFKETLPTNADLAKTIIASENTFIRVGSSNRQATTDIIAELERQKRNVSFDSELSYAKDAQNLEYHDFKLLFREKTGEALSMQNLKKMELYQAERDNNLPTNALILLSDDELRKKLFPYAKIECARFKGTIPGNFIDQKTIETSIALQPEQAYQFVLRHISQGLTDYTGVYRTDRWEYPVIAIREVLRNAVIHRDYSLTGKDIKIAIFDDKIEITSPGKLLPTVDFSDMESGQSDIRNKILAPVFKRLGIIEQWGNGLKLISEELKNYPEIGLDWKEPGIAFRVTFFKKSFISVASQETFSDTSEKMSEKMSEKILQLIVNNRYITIKELAESIRVTGRTIERNLNKLQKDNKLKRIGGDKGGHWLVTS